MMSFSVEIRKFYCSTHFRRVTRCVFSEFKDKNRIVAANLTLAGIWSRITVRSFSIDSVIRDNSFSKCYGNILKTLEYSNRSSV